ncbi:MAG: NifB/NifX family molybdenum-iron cluster-binding protein [Endomicrobiia bacterium]|nr:NifB/NifX family molybdenum-iron cluster-binding protein [Endomicrobiaceae bacterium]MDD5101680.1 NifB/NifX family molybdenum-iron cluster-binding protein [Endomicrobiaceae bacterium]
MRIGITLDDNKGLLSEVSQHFGQCKYFLIADIIDGKVANEKVVPNIAEHGGGGCVAVDEILKHNITHVIAGGMGAGAQQKFAMANVQIFGYSGFAKDGIASLLQNDLKEGIDACKDHSECH